MGPPYFSEIYITTGIFVLVVSLLEIGGWL